MTTRSPTKSALFRYIVALLALTVAYALAGRLALLLAIPPGYATAVWPAAGIALGAVLLWGNRLWPGVLLGSLLVNIWTLWDTSSLTVMMKSATLAVAIGGGAALQAVVGASLIRRWVGYKNIFTQEVDVVRMLLLGGPVSCLINSSVGVGSLWIAGIIPGSNLLFSHWTWWVGDTIGVLIFMPLVCAWSVRPLNKWLSKQIALSVPLLVLFVTVVVLFFYVSSHELERQQLEFERTAKSIGNSLQKSLDNHLLILDSMKSFYSVIGQVKRDQFRTFSSSILKNQPDVQAVAWLPKVTNENRIAFENNARIEVAPDYSIQDRVKGQLTIAAERPEYYPVHYIEPLVGNSSALGYDVGFEPIRRKALQHAIETGRATATDRINLVQETAEQWALIVFLPVYTGAANYPTREKRVRNMAGFVDVVIRIDNLVTIALKNHDVAGLILRIIDKSALPENSELYNLDTLDKDTPRKVGLTRMIPLTIADRNWSLELSVPSAYLVANRSWHAWIVMAVGLVVTGLVGILLLVLIGRQSKVEELVESQTAEIRRAEGRFKDLLENAPDAMVIINQQGVMELVNVQTESVFGYARDEMIGQPVELLIPERLRGQHVNHRNGYFSNPKVRPMGAGLELWGRRKDGTEFPIEISLSPMETATGTFATAAVRDITDRKIVEKELARNAENLKQSNEELEQFAFAASHDMQEPLRNVVSFTELLADHFKGRLDENTQQFMDFIIQNSKHMQALINDLLTFSRVGRLDSEMVPSDCEEILLQVMFQLKTLLQDRNVALTHDPLPKVFGVPHEINQLLQNLIGNAIKFQPGPNPRVHVSAQRDGDCWQLSVRDWGIGIKPEHQERVFQIFQRLHTRRQFEGTGIGLALCHKIVTRHGGRIWIESQPDMGSTFFFTLSPA